jgi:DNA-binding NarL/FixJ family response regulator
MTNRLDVCDPEVPTGAWESRHFLGSTPQMQGAALAMLLVHTSQVLALAGQALVGQAGDATRGAPLVELPRQPVLSGASEPRLSPRERQLLGLVGRGMTDREIADELTISLTTVHSHLDRIRDKTGRRRRTQLTRLALDLDLVLD